MTASKKSNALKADHDIGESSNQEISDNREIEMQQRKSFIGLNSSDINQIHKLNKLIQNDSTAIADAFYEHLLSFPDIQSLIPDDTTLQRLKVSLGRYFQSLTSGNYDLDYLDARRSIGTVHEQVGLDSTWFIGAYSKYLSLIIPKLAEYTNHDGEAYNKMLVAMLKIILLDISIANESYLLAREYKINQLATGVSCLNQIALGLTKTMDIDQLLEKIAQGAVELANSDAALVIVYNENNGSFEQFFTHGLSDNFIQSMKFRVGGMAETVLNSNKHVICNDGEGSEFTLSKLTRSEGIKGYICLPLVNKQKVGLLYVYRKGHENFEQQEIESLQTLSHLASGALYNAILHEATLSLATTDSLTDLFNRRAGKEKLDYEISRTSRYDHTSSIIMLDVDHFKHVNDNYGHQAGDMVLVTLADIFIAQLRNIDIVSRFGGEEFLIVLPETGIDGALIVANRIRKKIESTITRFADSQEIKVTASIGITIFNKDTSSDTGELINQADKALYAAKQSGRNTVCVYQKGS